MEMNKPIFIESKNQDRHPGTIIHLTQWNREVAVDSMDNDRILEKYLDKVDQDRRDQEQRIAKNMELMEKRLSDSEGRIEARFNQIMKSIEDTNKKVDDSIQRMENKFDKLTDEVKENNKYIRNISVTTIIGIAAMVIAVGCMIGTIVWSVFQMNLS